MIYSYSLSVSGDNFYPENILEQFVQGNLIVDSFLSPADKKRLWNGTLLSENYGFGSLSFRHFNKWTNDEFISKYEFDFVEFLDKYYQLFIENGAGDIRILMEIFYDGGQCNFEIFDKTLLTRLTKYNVSLPISISTLSKKELKKWENEIKLLWKTD
jgi:hypothetical protein